MSKVFLTPLLPFVSACLYGDAASFYAHLNEAERTELESQGKTLGMTAWFYRYLLDVLPEGKRQAFQKVYWLRKVRALSEEHELNRLCSVLRKSGLRFALIKGADLAYRLYPDPALRPHGDWDIWFHPDDCELALEKLAEDNWDTSVQYTDHQVFSEVFDAARKINEHHFFPHVRGGYIVEPHFTLPNFANVDPHELWAYTVEYREGGQHILSPELNLLMLTRHVASKAYFHANIPKLLTDAAVVMQGETVDFAMLCEMAARWRLPYSGDLLAAFREFFPSDVVSGFRADPEETSRFRTLFEKRAAFEKSVTE